MLSGYLPALLRGAEVTISLAILSLGLSVFLGLVGALAKQSHSRLLVWLATVYTTVIRGVPEFVLMLLIFYGGQIFLNMLFTAMGLQPPDLNAFLTAVLTIGFIFGAYFTETFRGAILAVPRGQMEAALAFGLPQWKAFFRILFPQMLRIALPAAGNNWLVLLKSTAVASLIGLHDVMFIADQAGRVTQTPFTFYLAACIVYLVLTTGSTRLLMRLNISYSKGVREGRLQ